MFVVYRGLGMLAPAFGLLFALLINVLTFRIFGAEYEDSKWPKVMILVMSGLACLVTGMLVKAKRKRDAELEQEIIKALPGSETIKRIKYSGPRDHLMFIPLQYWSVIYFVAAIVYVWVSGDASAR